GPAPRGRRQQPHVRPAGRGAGARTAMRRRGSTLAAALGLAMALAGQVGAAGAGGESELGRRFFLAARSELPLVEDPAVTEYVGQIGARLVKTLGAQEFDYRFYVVQSPVLNAFAVPGGYVFIFSGLLARVANDDELAGVLGHEMGHVSGHHIVRQQEKGQVWSAAALLGLLLSAVNPVAGAAGIAAAETQAVARAIADPPDVVIPRYRRLAEEKPDDAERQLLLGRVYQTVGQLEAARGALEKCRDLGGVGGRVDRPLGSVYVALKEPAKAREALERHLARHPDDAFAHTQLGKALNDAGDSAAALTEFQRALGLDPDSDEAQRLTGIALGRKGDEAEGFYHLALASRLRGE